MINENKLSEILEQYIDARLNGNWWKNEKFKWVAIKTFQDNWDPESPDFPEMLASSLKKSTTLLNAQSFHPKGMIEGMAKIKPNEVRLMFINLFDDSKNLFDRIDDFKEQSNTILATMDAAHHYQDEHAISTYLTLRFPNKYYAYKFSIAKASLSFLESEYGISQGKAKDNIKAYYQCCNEVREFLEKNRNELSALFSQIDDKCFPDTNLCEMTSDIMFFIEMKMKSEGKWKPEDYTPNISVNQWKKLISNNKVFTDVSMTIIGRLLAENGVASYTLLSEKYGENVQFYNSNFVALAKRIVNETGCPVNTKDEDNKWWPVLFYGRNEKDGTFTVKMRDELMSALINNQTPVQSGYSKESFLSDVFMSGEKYDILVGLLKKKKNIILQGAPGVGKTYAAKRLAWSIMGLKEEECKDRIEFIQFHQNYSYEDFIMGYRPSGEGFELKHGVFYDFCMKAENNPENDYYFIIDEINRGNLSKIFGELLMLIESDYRGKSIKLAYNGSDFSVPENVYIIGMMNTADRSLAMIDYALRRRFSFFEMEPAFNSDGFTNYKNSLGNQTFNRVIDTIIALNEEISKDASLGKGFCIGHSYFCGCSNYSNQWLRSVIDFDILPMLNEYWFDNQSKYKEWSEKLYEAVND